MKVNLKKKIGGTFKKRKKNKKNRKRKAKANKPIANRSYTFKSSDQSPIKIREKEKEKV